MTRLEANRLILKKLSDYIESNPDIRFNQMLVNLDIISNFEDSLFHKESMDTLEDLLPYFK